MNINAFILQYAIKPVDAIVLKKKFFGMVDHFVLYMGVVNGEHRFVANYVRGVEIIPNEYISRLLQSYVPSKIERFPGPESQRPIAIGRALSRIGQKAYSYLKNNCEHFKNFVHYGVDKSSQVENAGAGITILGATIALLGLGKKQSGYVLWGIVVVIIGLLLASLSNKPTHDQNYAS